jgi:hypothetical protein
MLGLPQTCVRVIVLCPSICCLRTVLKVSKNTCLHCYGHGAQIFIGKNFSARVGGPSLNRS